MAKGEFPDAVLGVSGYRRSLEDPRGILNPGGVVRPLRTDGIFLGQSAAAALLAATKVAQRPEAEGKTIVAICADNAFKYLSTNIYR
jgi:hypothetical protein